MRAQLQLASFLNFIFPFAGSSVVLHRKLAKSPAIVFRRRRTDATHNPHGDHPCRHHHHGSRSNHEEHPNRSAWRADLDAIFHLFVFDGNIGSHDKRTRDAIRFRSRWRDQRPCLPKLPSSLWNCRVKGPAPPPNRPARRPQHRARLPPSVHLRFPKATAAQPTSPPSTGFLPARADAASSVHRESTDLSGQFEEGFRAGSALIFYGAR